MYESQHSPDSDTSQVDYSLYLVETYKHIMYKEKPLSIRGLDFIGDRKYRI